MLKLCKSLHCLIRGCPVVSPAVLCGVLFFSDLTTTIEDLRPLKT